MDYIIQFYDINDRPLKITELEFKRLAEQINTAKFVTLKGNVIATATIRRIEPVRQEKVRLPPPEPPPITGERLMEFKKALLKKFTWN